MFLNSLNVNVNKVFMKLFNMLKLKDVLIKEDKGT